MEMTAVGHMRRCIVEAALFLRLRILEREREDDLDALLPLLAVDARESVLLALVPGGCR